MNGSLKHHDISWCLKRNIMSRLAAATAERALLKMPDFEPKRERKNKTKFETFHQGHQLNPNTRGLLLIYLIPFLGL